MNLKGKREKGRVVMEATEFGIRVRVWLPFRA